MKTFISKKLFVTILVLVMGFAAPIVFVKVGVDKEIALAFMAIVGGVGVAYGVVQGRVDAINAAKPDAPK